MALFRDRAEAARDLAPLIPPEIGPDWLLLALPRGGVPIAAALARMTGARFDILIVRKVGAPGNHELALAAVTGPEPGQMVVNEGLQQMLGLSHAQVTAAAAPEVAEIARRRTLWSADAPVALAGRKVAIVDDGAATGTTLSAAIAAARAQGVTRIAVILPVALGTSLQGLPADVGPVICPHPAARLSAVGQAYERFPQVEDAEVARLLAERAD